MLYRTGWPKTRSCLPSAEIPGIQHHTQQYNLELKPDSGTSLRLCSSDLDPPWVCVLTCKARAASESWWSDGIQEFQTLTMCNFSKGPRTFKTRKKNLSRSPYLLILSQITVDPLKIFKVETWFSAAAPALWGNTHLEDHAQNSKEWTHFRALCN